MPVPAPERKLSDTADDRPLVAWLIKGLGLGGAERLLVSVAEVRDRDAFRYETWYVRGDKDRLVADLAAQGVPAVLLGPVRWWDPRWLVRLHRRLRHDDVDVLHLHSPLVASGARLVVRMLPRRARPALLTTEHNVWPSYQPLTRLLNRLTFGIDHAHISVSEQVVESIPPRYRNGIEVIVHGVPVERLRALRAERAAMRRELGLHDDDVAIGTIANLRADKAYPVLLQAAVGVVARNPGVHFFSVGQGPLEQDVRRLRRELGLDDRFHLLGVRDDAPRVLSAFDVFTLASLHEGYPVSLMEALALSVPVVATEVGGIPSAIRNEVEGLLVPPNDPAALCDALERVVRDPVLRARMSAAAGRRAEAFDIRHAAERTQDIYRELAARRPHR